MCSTTRLVYSLVYSLLFTFEATLSIDVKCKAVSGSTLQEQGLCMLSACNKAAKNRLGPYMKQIRPNHDILKSQVLLI